MLEEKYAEGEHGGKTKIVGDGKVAVKRSEITIFKCDLCDKEFDNKMDYVEHMLSKTREDWDNIPEEKILNVQKDVMMNIEDNDIGQPCDKIFGKIKEGDKKVFQSNDEGRTLVSDENGNLTDIVEYCNYDSRNKMKWAGFFCPSCKVKRNFFRSATQKCFMSSGSIEFLFDNLIDFDRHMWYEHGILVVRKIESVFVEKEDGKTDIIKIDDSYIKRFNNISIEDRALLSSVLTKMFSMDENNKVYNEICKEIEDGNYIKKTDDLYNQIMQQKQQKQQTFHGLENKNWDSGEES